VAKLKVSPHFAGELLVTIGAEKLLKTVAARCRQAAAPSTSRSRRLGAGAISRRRCSGRACPGNADPARAIGVSGLNVDPGSKKLAVTLTPARQRSAQQLSIRSLSPAAAGQQCLFTVPPSDVGILNLTNYKAPDPEDWFFGQRMLGLEIRDLYGRRRRLARQHRQAAHRRRRRKHAGARPPADRKSWSPSSPGVVQLDTDGKARVDFDIPQFNGTVRVMAVAWTKKLSAMPSTTSSCATIVITAGLPRFLAPATPP